MNTLNNAGQLTPVKNTVTINESLFGGIFKSVLAEKCQISELKINKADLVLDESNHTKVTGVCNFLNGKNLPVEASFVTDAAGNVVGRIMIEMIGDERKANSWNFSRSFKSLPTVTDYSTEITEDLVLDKKGAVESKTFLDSLYLFKTYFVISTEQTDDKELGVPLTKGLNFYSSLLPKGALGVLEYALKEEPLTVYGHINIPVTGKSAPQLLPLDNIWKHPEIAGIHLHVPLNLNTKFGKTQLKDTEFRIYSPVSKQWLTKNSEFKPTQGYAATLSMPSANMEMDVWADTEWNLPEALFVAECEGFNISNLAALADIGGGKGLESKLPKQLKSLVKTLDKNELMRISFAVGLYNNVPQLSLASITVGMPNINWHIWGDHFVLDDIAVRFEIDNPMAKLPNKPSFELDVMGTVEVEGVPISVFAASANDFTFYAQLGEAQTIPLKKLVSKYAPGLPAPSDLTIDRMVATIAPGKFYGFSTVMASEPNPWTIPLGPSKLRVRDVNMSFTVPNKGKTIGSVGGVLEFSKGVEFAVAYDLPGDVQIRGVFPKSSLSHLIGTLTNQKVAMPKGFDIEFEYAFVVIKKYQNNYLLSLATDVEGLGVMAFELRRNAGKWGFATGLQLDNQPSSVPGLNALNKIEKAFGLKEFTLVVSSFDDPSFTFPSLTQFQTPVLATKKVSLPAHTSGVVDGINIFAKWEIDKKDKFQKLLSNLFGLDSTLDVVIQTGENPTQRSRMYTQFDTTLNGHPFKVQLGAVMEMGSVGLFMTGSMTVKIQKKPQLFDVTTLFVPNGAFISANLSGPNTIKFGSFQLSELALEIGVSLQGIPSLGIAASIDTKSFDSSVAIFFDSADPAKSLVAGSMSDLNLKEVVDELVGGRAIKSMDKVLSKVSVAGTHNFKLPGSLSKELDNRKVDSLSSKFWSEGGIRIPSSSQKLHLVVANKGKTWFLTDMDNMRHYQLTKVGSRINVSMEAQFYCAPEDTYIGTKQFKSGFFLNGKINVLGFHAAATIQVNTRQGIAVDAKADKIVIGNEQLFCLKAARGNGGAQVSIATFKQPKQKNKLFRNPHFYVNGKLEMLGLSESMFVTISEKGAEFELKGNLSPLAHFDLKGLFANTHHLDVSGDVKVGIGTINLGALGKVKIHTDVEGYLDVGFDGKKITATCKASFEALGQRHRIARFHLNVKGQALKNIGKTLEKEMEKVLSTALKDVEKWAKAVDKGLVTGVKDTEHVMKTVFKASDKEIHQIGKGLTGAAKDVGKGVETATKDVGKAAKSVGKSVGRLFGKKKKKRKHKKK